MKDMSTENSKKSNFKFLSDEAVREIENDRLKHPSIAEAIKTLSDGLGEAEENYMKD